MRMSLKRIDVVVLFVVDLDRATAFYRDTLGLRIQFQDQNSTGVEFETTLLILLNIAGAQDLLSPDAVTGQRSGGANFQLVAFVDDVDAFYTDLTDRGVEFVRPPIDRPWGMRTAHFKDPEGNIWEIAQSLPKTADGA